MECINKSFTIQWLGPFDKLDVLKDYFKGENGLDKGLFNFYYFEARKTIRSKPCCYFGIHKKNDGITKRLTKSHSHYKDVKDFKYVNIWIGSLGRKKDQTIANVDLVETLFIRAYKDIVSENDRKKKSLPAENVTVINYWYDEGNHLKHRKKNETCGFHDVICYVEKEFHKGNLSRKKDF